MEKFNTSFRYIDDVACWENSQFLTYVKNIYPKKLNILQSNNSDDKATFLDIDIQTSIVLSKFTTIYIILIWKLSITLVLMEMFLQVHHMRHTCLN